MTTCRDRDRGRALQAAPADLGRELVLADRADRVDRVALEVEWSGWAGE